MTFPPHYWALIIGGSSGFGLATAKKLADQGMNLCIIHRDRRGAMSRITPEFKKLTSSKIKVLTFNLDALSDDGRTIVLDTLEKNLGDKGRIRLLLHTVAFGNLKLLAPFHPSDTRILSRKEIAKSTGTPEGDVHQIIRSSFEAGFDSLHTLIDPPGYDKTGFLDKNDFAHTIHAMGSNIVEWVQDIFNRRLFAEDARVLSLTSEGNSMAWRGYAAVAAAKAVLESVSRAMAVEFAPHGIRTNVIQAGVTDTAALQAIPGNRHIRAHASLRNPFGRLTTPEDVADVIYLLCRDEAAWINGALICADGGEHIA